MHNILRVLVDMKYEPWCEKKSKIKDFILIFNQAAIVKTNKTVKILFDRVYLWHIIQRQLWNESLEKVLPHAVWRGGAAPRPPDSSGSWLCSDTNDPLSSVSERVNQRFPGSKLIPSSVIETAVARETAEISFQHFRETEETALRQDTTDTSGELMSSFIMYMLIV